MDVHQDYKEFVISLNVHKVKYLIVGAHAVGFYAIPRYTKDIDFWIECSLQNAKRFLSALRDFFGENFKLTAKDISNPNTILQFGVAPVRIDVITSIAGVKFKTAWKNRISSRYGSEPANYISLEDLIKSKMASGREQDLRDLKFLVKAKEKSIRK